MEVAGCRMNLWPVAGAVAATGEAEFDPGGDVSGPAPG